MRCLAGPGRRCVPSLRRICRRASTRLLLMRLRRAATGPTRWRYAPRAPRQASPMRDVRVVVGLAGAGPRGRRSRVACQQHARSAGCAAAAYDESHADGEPDRQPQNSVGPARAGGRKWRLVDRRRERLPAGRAGQGCAREPRARSSPFRRPRELDRSRSVRRSAARAGRRSHLPASRSSPRRRSSGSSCAPGSRRWMSQHARPSTGRSSACTCRPMQPTGARPRSVGLIEPRPTAFVPGGIVELDTGNARCLVRFSQTIETPGRLGVGRCSDAVRQLSSADAATAHGRRMG